MTSITMISNFITLTANSIFIYLPLVHFALPISSVMFIYSSQIFGVFFLVLSAQFLIFH